MYRLKRVTSVIIVVITVLFFLSGVAIAEGTPTPQIESPTDTPTDITVKSTVSLTDYNGETTFTGDTDDVYSLALIDADSGTILYKKNIDEQIEPASTTKIMTCLLALESGKLDEKVTVSSKAANQGGSNLLIKNGEKIVLRDLINGMMMASGNDAAVAVAEFLGGDIGGFSVMMNAKADELGMKNTNFTVSHGMHAENHYSTSRDMAILTIYAMQNEEFAAIVKQKSYTMPADNKHSSVWTKDNTNKLLQPDDDFYYQYATGIKTGQTPLAKDCLVSSATKGDMNLICLVFKAKYESPVRWTITKNLFAWGFDNFSTIKLSTLMTNIDPVQVQAENYSPDDSGSGVLLFDAPDAENVYLTLAKSTAENLANGTDEIVLDKKLREKIEAPIMQGDKIGTVTYLSKATGEALYTQELLAPRDVLEAGSSSTDGQTAVETLAPTPPVKVMTPSDNGLVWLFMIIPVGLIVFLVIRIMTVRRGSARFKKYRRPHYSYKIK